MRFGWDFSLKSLSRAARHYRQQHGLGVPDDREVAEKYRTAITQGFRKNSWEFYVRKLGSPRAG